MLEKTLRWVVIAGIFILPVFIPTFVAESLFFPFITGKNFAFRIIVEIIAGAYLALALTYPEYRPKRSWILWAVGAFVVIIGLADIFGAYPMKSIWSNYERMDGWMTVLHLGLYTLVAACILNTAKLWRWLFWTNLGVSVYLAIYGFLQIAGISALGQGGAAGLSARIDATFGNPIYFAVYMLFNIFIAALLWVQQWQERARGGRLPLSLAYATVIILDTLALLFTGTRGTILGLIGGAFLAAALMLISSNQSRYAWRFAAGAVAAILLLVGGFWLIRDSAFVHEIGFLQRLASISTSDQTARSRFINWSIAWGGVKERPILGWGQENYALVFDKYYDPRMWQQEQWFDRVHNIIFDWLVAGGFLGLLAYLSIFAASVWALWRGQFSTPERSILIGLLAGYFVHNFFVFDNVTSYILWGTILAYIVWRSTGGMPEKQSSIVFPKQYLAITASVCALLVWGGAWVVNAKPLMQNRLLLQSIAPQQEGISKNLENFKASLALHSLGTQEVREQLALGTSQVLGASGVPQDMKQKFFDLAVSEMKLQMQESASARAPLMLGAVYNSAGAYADAKIAFDEAFKRSPKKQTVLFELGQNAVLRGDLPAAVQYYKTAFDLDHSDTLARISYAAVLIRAGDDKTAEEQLAPIIKTGEAADPRIASAYLARKRYDKIAAIWEARVAAQPQDLQAYFTLAAAYYGVGDRAKAIGALERAKTVSPDVAGQVDELEKQIRNGTAKLE